MSKIGIERLKQLIPPWSMPADPVRAVWWFMHWLVIVLVRFFWIPILAMIIFETSLNWNTFGFFSGLVSGIITLLVGLVVWGLLYGLMTVIKVAADISRIVSDIKQFQNRFTYYRHTPYPFMHPNDTNSKPKSKVVETTVVEVEEEQK